jgi:hypothetical protein
MELLVAVAEETLDQQETFLMVEDQEDLELQLHLYHQVRKHFLVEAEVVMEMHLADRLEDLVEEHHLDHQRQLIQAEEPVEVDLFKELHIIVVDREESI